MLKNIAITLTLISFLSGCAIMARPYQDVNGNNIAELTVTNSFGAPMFAHTYAEEKQCRSQYLIGYLQQNESKTIKISTDQKFAYRLHAGFYSSCMFTIGFQPSIGKKYTTTMIYNSELEVCELSLREELDNGSSKKVDNAYVKSNSGGTRMDQNSTWCSKDELDKYAQ